MENLRGALLMTASMAGFALEDLFVKLLTQRLPVGEVLAILGILGTLVFAAGTMLRREAVISRAMLRPVVIARNTGELVGTLGFVLAIALTPLAQASAILQALPLVVTLGAVLFLGERVGWRRWSAIAVGFLGVMIVLRPGAAGFDPKSIFAVIGVLGLAARDLVTRRVPRDVSAWQLSTWAFATVVPAGLVLMVVTGARPLMPHPWELLAITGGVGFGVMGYLALVAAMRMGDVSSVTPFRYTRLVFAVIIGWAVFAETPDLATLIGGAVIVASGIYTVMREAALRRRSI
ncbi:DMT family transporter [Phaeovulum vinaykumarii]|uniref:Permease of the drug/metabolite transporter (DMT) superfamily n=1 Tax=Phaeovulum vinaykumarii TaxID=407234 RepID=A0A1N7M2Z5_9RHOB|nr:DMT family transporter [Phaeovulum vinaykumarii]SIS80321.1 Permease of the drug/metabolite transporter (DMT) superfamily [Phaeovulum vinaykumarii]SOC09286.1 drug/metabolite transporter (DMT)-like permease [Phaeovulum vinaykumarii]